MIRLMMDFSGTNRGFAYITFMTNQEAKNAVSMWHGFQLDEANPTKLVVVPSFDNKGLLFLGLPANCTKTVLLKCLREKLKDVSNVRILPPQGLSRGAEVFFKSHGAACSARRLLVPGSIKILDCIVTVDWAKPQLKSTEECSENSAQTLIDQNNNSILEPSIPRTPRPALVPRHAHQSNADANYEIMPLSPDNILGARGQAILHGCNDFDQRYLVVRNIDKRKVDETKLTTIFELSGRLQVLSIVHLGNEATAIEYANVEQTLFMLETLVLVPDCFSKLALPGHTLTAYLSSLAGLGSSIPRGYSITHF